MHPYANDHVVVPTMSSCQPCRRVNHVVVSTMSSSWLCRRAEHVVVSTMSSCRPYRRDKYYDHEDVLDFSSFFKMYFLL